MVFLENLFVIGTLLSIVGSFFVAKLFLQMLPKIFARQYSRARGFKIFSLGSLSGMLCGVICTTFIYGVMWLVPVKLQEEGLRGLAGGGFIMLYGEAIAVVVGAIAGAFLTALYSHYELYKDNESNEANKLS